MVHQVPLTMDLPGKNIGVGCHFLLLETFPIQESNPCLLSLALQAKAFNSKPLGKKQNNTKHSCCKSVRTVVVCGSEPRLPLPLPFSAQLRETPPQTGADKNGQEKVFLMQTRGTWCYKEVAGEDS